MKTTLILFGTACCLFLASCDSQDPTRENETARNAATLEAAPFRSITDSIRNDPKNTGLYLRRASLLTQQGEHPLAYADLEKAWGTEPSEEIGEMMVNSLFMAGNNEKALALLQDLTKRFPENTNLKRRMGEAQLQGGQYDQALASFDKLIAADSLDFEAYYEKALLYLEKRDTPMAISNLETSYRIQPLQLTALLLANIYAETRDPRSLLMADLAMERDSSGERVDPVFIKGIYYANIGNTTRALEQFNKVIAMDWKFHEAYIEKGIIYFEQKNLDEALQQFKLASTVSNTYPDAYYWQGRCYEALGKKEEALTNYGRAYALDRNFTEAVEAAARVKGSMGR